ncbi:MAG: LysM peptidoglycan-binding domain-containing protein [Anaerolineae bacterium]|nr:LysM peptidoglycan-binding domain-containing protein [Anaerolineae bacterium]
MKKPLFYLLGAALFGFTLMGVNIPASAAPAIQTTPYATPTAGADGRILYIVQPNDTLWGISAITGVALEQLRSLNNLGLNDTIRPGQVLVLGFAESAVEPTAVPEATQVVSAVEPLPEGVSNTAIICFILFEDANGDSSRQDDEASIPGGAVSVTERTGQFSNSVTTEEGIEPYCFESVPGGEYNVSVAVPDGYNPTTVLNMAHQVNAGDEFVINFGAQKSSQAAANNPGVSEGGRSPLFGVIGVTLLMLGAGLGYYSMQMGKR